MSKQKKKQSNVSIKFDVKKKKKRKTVPGYVQKAPDRVKTLLTCPDSALTETNIKTFVNEETLHKLPSYLQYKLITLLPICDQNIHSDGSLVLSDEAFTNEFFTKACEEWRSKLAEGCFTDDRLQHMNIERSRQQASDTWKIKYFESAVPLEQTLSNCSQPSLNGLTTSALNTSRKRKFDGEEEDPSQRNSVEKQIKTCKIKEVLKTEATKKAKHEHLSKMSAEKVESPLKSSESKQPKVRKDQGFNKKKPAATKRLSKASCIRKTKSLKSIKAGKKICRDSKEDGVFKSNIGEDAPDVKQKCNNGQLIKSKILSHLNNKLIKSEKLSNSDPSMTEGPVELQTQMNQNDGTLTLSDLISREFELVCNGSTRETMASTLKFENLKVGFFSPKMFQLGPPSTSNSLPMLPHVLKLMTSTGDPKLVPSLEDTSNRSGHPSIFSETFIASKESKIVQSSSFAVNADSPLAEYFPLLSSSLKCTSKLIEPTIAQLKMMNSKRRTQNSVERETLLCLANKLNQKLFGKINFTSPSPGNISSSSTNTSKTLESSAEWLQTSSSPVNKTPLVLNCDTNSKCSTSKQPSISTRFDLLKNILLSISTKSSSASNSTQPLKSTLSSISTSMSNSSPFVVSSVVSCTSSFSEEGIQRSAASTGTDKFGKIDISNPSPVSSPGYLVSPSCESFSKDLTVLSTTSQRSPCSKLPIPVFQTNLMDQRSKCLNKNVNNINLVPRGNILEIPFTINPKATQSIVPLQMKVLPQRFSDMMKTSAQSNTSLQHVGVASSKVQPLTYVPPTLQTQLGSSINMASNLGSSNVDVSVNDILLRNLILNEKNRIHQNVLKQTPSAQMPPVQGERLVTFTSQPSNVYISGTSVNNNNNNNNNNSITNGDDNVKVGRTSFQIPLNSLMSTLRLQNAVPQGNQISSFQAPSNSSINVSNGSSPLIIFSPVNQQLNLASYLTVNSMSPENILNRSVAPKKAEMTQNNVFQLNPLLMSPPTYLPMVNMPQLSPTMPKSQILLLQNASSAASVSSKTLAIPPDPTNSGLKNVTFIPIVNTSTNNQMLLLLSPNVANQK